MSFWAVSSAVGAAYFDVSCFPLIAEADFAKAVFMFLPRMPTIKIAPMAITATMMMYSVIPCPDFDFQLTRFISVLFIFMFFVVSSWEAAGAQQPMCQSYLARRLCKKWWDILRVCMFCMGIKDKGYKMSNIRNILSSKLLNGIQAILFC